MAREEITDPAAIADVVRAARALAGGTVVAYPTETVYGLGVDARRREAIDALVELKGRDAGRGISVLVTDLEMAAPLLAAPATDDVRALARAFWPGPLTIVLPASSSVDRALCGPSGGVGLRCSSDPWAALLIRTFAGPITSTSANRSGEAPARSADDVRRAFPTGEHGSPLGFLLDGGPRTDTSVSTVVEFSKGRATVLRDGAIRIAEIASVITLAPVQHP